MSVLNFNFIIFYIVLLFSFYFLLFCSLCIYRQQTVDVYQLYICIHQFLIYAVYVLYVSQTISLSIYLSTSVYVSLHYLSICLCLSVYLSIYLSTSVYVSLHHLYVSVYQPIYLSIYFCLCQSASK